MPACASRLFVGESPPLLMACCERELLGRTKNPDCGSLQCTGLGTDRQSSPGVESRNRGQVSRATSCCRFLLDGNINPGGCPEGDGIPLQPEPPERRSLACTM